MPEPANEEAALAKIAAAADSIDALSVAVEKAAFLDQKPGEGRQKLRGQCFNATNSSRHAIAGPTCWLGNMLITCMSVTDLQTVLRACSTQASMCNNCLDNASEPSFVVQLQGPSFVN